MIFYSVSYWQDHWDELIKRVEEGETIGVDNGKNKAVMVPPDQDYVLQYYTTNEAS